LLSADVSFSAFRPTIPTCCDVNWEMRVYELNPIQINIKHQHTPHLQSSYKSFEEFFFIIICRSNTFSWCLHYKYVHNQYFHISFHSSYLQKGISDFPFILSKFFSLSFFFDDKLKNFFLLIFAHFNDLFQCSRMLDFRWNLINLLMFANYSQKILFRFISVKLFLSILRNESGSFNFVSTCLPNLCL